MMKSCRCRMCGAILNGDVCEYCDTSYSEITKKYNDTIDQLKITVFGDKTADSLELVAALLENEQKVLTLDSDYVIKIQNHIKDLVMLRKYYDVSEITKALGEHLIRIKCNMER